MDTINNNNDKLPIEPSVQAIRDIPPPTPRRKPKNPNTPTRSRKSQKYKTYPPALWAQIRALYESGLYKSVVALHAELSNLPQWKPYIPSLKQMQEKYQNDGWGKSLQSAIPPYRQQLVDGIIKEIPPETVVNRLRQMIDKRDVIVDKFGDEHDVGVDSNAIDKSLNHIETITGIKQEEKGGSAGIDMRVVIINQIGGEEIQI